MNPKLLLNLDKVLFNCIELKKITNRILKNKKVKLFYAVKANYLKEVRDLILKEGYGAEVLSEYELDLLEYETPVVINGHAKSHTLLLRGLERMNSQIIVESVDEINRICSIYRREKFSRPINIGIRIPYLSSRIGFQIDDIYLLKKLTDENEFLNIDMLHFHSGWNNHNDDSYKEQLILIADIHNILKKEGIKVTKWNIGGSYCEHSQDKNQLPRRLKMLNSILPIEVETVYLEPGRFLVGDAGELHTTVISDDRGEYLINSSTYGYWLSGATSNLELIKKNGFKSKINVNNESNTVISGIWPSDNDCIKVDNVEISVGDIIVFHNMGAYLNGSMTNIAFDFDFNYTIIHKIYNLWKLANEEEKKVLVKFWDFKSNIFKKIPKRKNELILILNLISNLIDHDTKVTESKLNELLSLYFKDFATIRREMVENNILINTGGIYERK